MSTGTRAPTLVLAAAAAGLTGIGGVGLGIIGLSEAVSFGSGVTLTLILLAGRARHRPDALYPARMQLARLRRSGERADVLVVELPASISLWDGRPTRKCASAVSSLLRVTDGVSTVPALRGSGVCAVLGSDEGARAAIDRRLRDACGDQIDLAWASSPDDGVTLGSLLEAALDRLPRREPGLRQRRRGPRPAPVQPLLPGGLEPDRGSMRSVH
jgi:hypothetical protein